MAFWAQRKGIAVVGTGDFTHPAWFDELRAKLVPAEPGLFRLKPEIEREVASQLPTSCRREVRFLLEVEISTIYKKGERTRKVHHLIYASNFDTAARLREKLGKIGNLNSDGRPILGLDSRHLLEITLDSGPDAYLVPAHVWTPWFSTLGSKSGFDSVEECYGDLAEHIFAVETGLSSDPAMNARVSRLDRFTLVSNSDAHSPPMLGREASRFETPLDYFAMRWALETGEGWGGSVEFFPEEGKYHLDGHRACGVKLEPHETRERSGLCPVCGKGLTVGVMHRVEELADRPEGEGRPEDQPLAPFRSLVPLPEVVAELHGVGVKSRAVEQSLLDLAIRLGPELELLDEMPVEDVAAAGEGLLAEALTRLRAGQVHREAGYDGEYGVIRLFEPGELHRRTTIANLFSEVPISPPVRPKRHQKEVPPDSPKARTGQKGVPGTSWRPSLTSILENLDPEQRAAAEIVDGPLLILAGPGTGKTRTLTHRLAHLVAEKGVPPEACLAITFTRRAAAEMKERLATLLPGVSDRLLVTTFHGLGWRLVREQREALGLPEEVRIQAENEAPAPGALGFDDLLRLPVELLEARPELAAHYRERFRFISIDEYQDLDAMQVRLVRLLAGESANLCAIGDPDQSIYSFRGADVGLFLRFDQDFPGARRVVLSRSYRSTPTLVEAASQAITPSTLAPGRRLEAQRGDPGERLVVIAAASERAEAEQVVVAIEDLLGGTSHFAVDTGRAGQRDGHQLSFGDFAVLYRTEAQSAPLIEALSRAGIPFQKRSHRPLVEQPWVARLVSEVELALGGDTAAPRSVESRLAAAAKALGSGDGASERSSNSAALLAALEALRPLAVQLGDDLQGFVAAVRLGTGIDTWDPRAEGVSLLTLHAAKGLEFPVVFVIGCEEGLLPFALPGREPENVEEERRLFFVGLTRAQDRLFLLHKGRPSPFLAPIADRLVERHRDQARPRTPKQLRLL